MERAPGPPRTGTQRPPSYRAATETVEFQSGSETVRGAYTLPRYATAKGTVVFLHGLLSSREEFDEFPLWVSDEGYASLAFDFRGHGQSDGPRSLVSVERHLGDVESAVRFLEGTGRLRGPLSLVGHSLGGVTTLAVAADARFAAKVRSLVIMAPFRAIKDELSLLERLGYAALHGVDLVSRRLNLDLSIPYKARYEDLFADPEALARAKSMGFLQERVRVANWPYVKHLDATRFAAHVKAPTLVMVGGQDTFILPARSKAVFDALRCEKEWAEVAKSGHSMMLDHASAEVFDHLVTWLDRWA